MGRLEGRVALVTGAGRGIGRATATRFAREGARVCLADEEWRTVLNVHLPVQPGGAEAHGRAGVRQDIVNVSSTSALGNRETLAIELGRYGVTVNAVAPGFIETEMTREAASRLGVDFEEFVGEMVKNIPVGRSGWPEDRGTKEKGAFGERRWRAIE